VTKLTVVHDELGAVPKTANACSTRSSQRGDNVFVNISVHRIREGKKQVVEDDDLSAWPVEPRTSYRCLEVEGA
jgi:hypothetical protein